MAFNDVLPSYVEPCIVEKTSDYDWRSVLDYGEYYHLPSDSHEYPSIILVYNGKVLNVQPELVHASLSGISIKHYYGKCYKDTTEDEDKLSGKVSFFQCGEEPDDCLWFNQSPTDDSFDSSKNDNSMKSKSTTESGSFDYREDSAMKEGQPIFHTFSKSRSSVKVAELSLTKVYFTGEAPDRGQNVTFRSTGGESFDRIPSRNSFWNIHRPEMCKLTWGQKYVSAATVTEHLHEHLTSHGQLCVGFHTEEERDIMLNKELDEYVRLKVLACPKILPPDEPLFDFKAKPRYSPRCKVPPNFSLTDSNRYYWIKNDEEIRGKEIRRTKEEFCLTIGKHIPEPLFVPSEVLVEETYITPKLSSAREEEAGSGIFYYDWFLYGEEMLEGQSTTPSTSLPQSSTSSEEICPPLMLDDFCRNVGKADFSDLRCDPDL